MALGSGVRIIEELQVFPQGQPVQNLLLDSHGVSGLWNELDYFVQEPASVPCPKQDGKFRALASDCQKDVRQNLSGVPWVA